MGHTASIWTVFLGAVAFTAIGSYHLFQAKAQRDQALRFYEARQGWFWSAGRWILLAPGYILSFRIGGAAAIVVGLLLFGWGVWSLSH